MKHILTILTAAVIAIGAAIPAQAQTVKGEKALGPKIGYISENSSAVAGLFFHYSFSEHLRISPEIGCAFRNQDSDAFLVDINMHFPFALSSQGKVNLYPIAGLAFNSWNHHIDAPDLGDDVTTHTNRFGVNAGAGFDLRCSESLQLNLEAKYTLVKRYSSFIATIGICYVF